MIFLLRIIYINNFIRLISCKFNNKLKNFYELIGDGIIFPSEFIIFSNTQQCDINKAKTYLILLPKLLSLIDEYKFV